MSQFINRDPNGYFAKYYREAKMLYLQIKLNVSFVNKAKAGEELDKINRRLQLCRQSEYFDVLRGARQAKEIDKDIDAIRDAYLRGK